MTDVNLRSISRIFAHKKTIEQFLQPMIERAGGGGGSGWVDVPGGCAAIFGSIFQSYHTFVSVVSIQ